MPEISQSTPIKPAWPVRRDDSRRQYPEADKKDNPSKNKTNKQMPTPVSDGGDKPPQIDDYA